MKNFNFYCQVHFIFGFSFLVKVIKKAKKISCHFQAKCGFFHTENKQTGQQIFFVFGHWPNNKKWKMEWITLEHMIQSISKLGIEIIWGSNFEPEKNEQSTCPSTLWFMIEFFLTECITRHENNCYGHTYDMFCNKPYH